MKLLDLEIRQKTKTEIINTLEPLIYKIAEEKQVILTENTSLYIIRNHFTNDLKRLHILAQNSLFNIKLNYYKRNLANLEILSDKQNLPPNITLALKIVRENLEIKHISKHLNTYNWYQIYKEKKDYLITY